MEIQHYPSPLNLFSGAVDYARLMDKFGKSLDEVRAKSRLIQSLGWKNRIVLLAYFDHLTEFP